MTEFLPDRLGAMSKEVVFSYPWMILFPQRRNQTLDFLILHRNFIHMQVHMTAQTQFLQLLTEQTEAPTLKWLCSLKRNNSTR